MALEVLIIGGGPAGATTAILLATAGWSVGLIEKKQFPRKKVCGEFISATNLPLLQKLELETFFLENAGPEVQKVGLYSGELLLTADMPIVDSSLTRWGRALGREYLDTALIDKAKLKGARVWQPCEAIHLVRNKDVFVCSVTQDNKTEEISAPLVIVANGSWEKRIVQTDMQPFKPSDLLAFKAHFLNSTLPLNLMPLLAFPGGYGGLVHTNNQRVTLSCCIRRDTLYKLRLTYPGLKAAEAVFEYILTHCGEVREVFSKASVEGKWLAAGPIHPGIRSCYQEGIFFVGNIAGEAHPVVAEGISMAMQSAWLLSQILINNRGSNDLDLMGDYYTIQWRKHFANRIHAASMFAQLAMLNAPARSLLMPILKQFPSILTLGAKLSGKIQQIVPL